MTLSEILAAVADGKTVEHRNGDHIRINGNKLQSLRKGGNDWNNVWDFSKLFSDPEKWHIVPDPPKSVERELIAVIEKMATKAVQRVFPNIAGDGLNHTIIEIQEEDFKPFDKVFMRFKDKYSSPDTPSELERAADEVIGAKEELLKSDPLNTEPIYRPANRVVIINKDYRFDALMNALDALRAARGQR